MTDPLLQQGLDLMIYGMGTVFLFLTLLVTVTTVASAIIGRFFPEGIESDAASTGVLTNSAVDKKLLAILQRAIDQHRGKK